MTTDLENRLWQQLEIAAERQARAGAITRWARARLPGSPVRVLRPAIGLVAAAAAAVVAVTVVRPPAPPVGHRQIQQFTLAGTQFSAGAAGVASSLWAYDVRSRAILRIDPGARRVLARIPAQGQWSGIALAGAPGAVWAVSAQVTVHGTAPANPAPTPLLRIDPHDNRIVARIPLRAPDHSTIVPAGIVANTGAVWVWGDAGAQRIDPATNRVTTAIRVTGDNIRGFAADDTDVWVSTELGRLVHFDARTGARLGSAPFTADVRTLILVRDLLVYDRGDGALTGLSAPTRSTRWTTHLGTGAGETTVAGGRLWVLTPDPRGPNDQLVSLDAETGHIYERITLPTAQGEAVAPIGPTLVATTSTGRIVIVHNPK